MNRRDMAIRDLFDQAIQGDRRALGRLLTFVERAGQEAVQVSELSHRATRGAHVVGITGAPGAGKSTLTGQLLRLLTDADLAPSVLAVDPSSPLTGGAILGDRVRMDDVAGQAAFIRSVATRGHGGGLALSVPGCVRLFDSAGYDPVLIETVGVGQVEVDVVGAADTTVVVVNPGWGDAVQANKAGLLEVADIFVINKADRPGAADSRRDLELMLDLSHVSGQEDSSGYRPPIVMTTATKGDGATDLWNAIVGHKKHLDRTGQLAVRRRRRIVEEISHRLRDLIDVAATASIESDFGVGLVAEVVNLELTPSAAADQLAATVMR